MNEERTSMGKNKRTAYRQETAASSERERQIQEFLTRAVEAVYPSTEALADALRSDKRLTAYMGIDPTAPEMHVGHESQLHKLKRLQDLGHRVILLIGDFTAMIGDPTDKTAARVRLTREQVLQNAQSYKEQASKILDFKHPTNPVELRYNSEWLGKLGAEGMLELASMMTVQQMSQRDMFQKRFGEDKPVWIHEFLYPLLQGYDSVAMEVDIEIGGSDQIFNMLVGSDLVKRELGKQKFVVGGKLLVDPTGKKIGKTEGNMITLIDTPEDMYHKIMMWGDAIVPHALELCTTVPMEEIHGIAQGMRSGELDGISAKMLLARTVVTELHSTNAAQQAEEQYKALASGKIPLTDIQEAHITPGTTIIDLLVQTNLAPSKSAARRLISGHGVRINGATVEDVTLKLGPESSGQILQVGKKLAENFRRISITNPDEK